MSYFLLQFDCDNNCVLSRLFNYLTYLYSNHGYRFVKKPNTYQLLFNSIDEDSDEPIQNTLLLDSEEETAYYLTVGTTNDTFKLVCSNNPNSQIEVVVKKSEQIVGANRATKYISAELRFVCYEDMTIFSTEFSEWIVKEIKNSAKPLKNKLRLLTINDDFEWESTVLKNTQSIENIFIKPEIKNNIISRIQAFFAEKDRAIRLGKPHKLNLLFHGVPGSGKTSLVKALAKEFQKRLYIIQFTKELSDKRFSQIIQQVRKDSIIVMEDIDAFFVGRNSNNINISFSNLLNQLDGIQNSDSSYIVILTANHVDQLDPALVRKGRMDMMVKFDYPSKEEVKSAFDVYIDHLSQEEKDKLFKEWYPKVKGKEIAMSAFTDFFFFHSKDLMQATEEFLKEIVEVKKVGRSEVMDRMLL